MSQGKYHFYEDGGHGWLEVPRTEVEASGAAITPCSYYDSQTDMVYLEEDVDMPNFMKATGITLDNISKQPISIGISGIRTLPLYVDAK
jgi:hypothetical protein